MPNADLDIKDPNLNTNFSRVPVTASDPYFDDWA